jgi:hypothetical protein
VRHHLFRHPDKTIRALLEAVDREEPVLDLVPLTSVEQLVMLSVGALALALNQPGETEEVPVPQ